MPLLDLQRQLRRLGKLRTGQMVEGTNAKGESYTRPSKLATWRITSPFRDLLDALTTTVGGAVEPWSSPDGDQWELISETDTLDVVIPPGDVFSQWHELWSGGGCVRRCDGEVEQISGSPCVCPADPQARAEASKQRVPTGCKPTTRLSVIVPAAPDLGVFMVESHSYYAAVELGGTFDVLRAARPAGTMLQARLTIEQRSKVAEGKTTRYAVPILQTPGLSFNALTNGGGTLTEFASGGQYVTGSPMVDPPAIKPPAAVAAQNRQPALPPPPLPPATAPTVDPAAPVIVQGQQLKAGDGAAMTNARVGALDAEHLDILGATLNARGVDLDDPAADRVLDAIEKQQRAAHLARQKRANAAMSAMGITDDDARHQFISDATGGATSSSGHLSDEQCKLVVEAAS